MSVVHLSVGGVLESVARVAAKVTGSSSRLAISTSPILSSPTFFGPLVPSNGIVKFFANGLTPNTQYYYGVEDDGVLDTATTGKFRTFPTAGSPASFMCIVSSCAGDSASGDLIATGVSNRPVFDTIRNKDPLFFVHEGDRSYVNRATNDVAGFRTDYDTVMSASRQHNLYRNVPTVYMWDDHDFGDNDCNGSSPSRPAVSQVYRERIPSYPLPAGSTGDNPIYHSFEVGRILFIISDTRHDRSSDTDTDGPSKTMLGSAQKTWMAGVLAASTAKFLVWINPTPWMGLSDDTWNGFNTERDELVGIFDDNGAWLDRMVTVNGDNHSNAMDTGGGNAHGHFPVWMWGSMDCPATGVSFQYDMGPSSPGIDRYGTIEVEDDGGTEIRVTGTGYIGTSPWLSYTIAIPVGAIGTTPPRTFAASYDPVLSRLRLSASGLALGADHVDVDRSTNQNTWTPVRGGVHLPVASSVSTDVLNANPYFETDASGYTMGGGSTLARVTTQHHEGAASGQITPAGSTVTMTTDTASPEGIVGNTYTASVWVFSVAGWSQVWVALAWMNSAGSVLSLGTGPTTAIPAATWTQLTVTGVAPAGTGRIGARVAMLGTPASTDKLFVDQLEVTTDVTDNSIALDDYEFTSDVANFYRIRSFDVVDTQLEEFVSVNTPVLDGVWLKSISRPFLNRQVTVVDFGDVGRPFRGGVFDIVGRSDPVAVTDLRGSRRYDLTVLAPDATSADDFDVILASGDPVFVHVPAGSLVPRSMYAVIGDTTEGRTGRRSTRRTFNLPLTGVAAPGPDVIGATITCAGVLLAFGACQDVLDNVATCADMLELIGSPDEVVVS